MVGASLILVLATTNVVGANATNETVLLQFTSPYCGPCQQVKPVVARLITEGYPVRQIQTNLPQNKQIASKYGITSIPCFVAVSNGRVVQKVVGYRSYDQLRQLMKQTGISKPNNALANARGQSPENRDSQNQFRSAVYNHQDNGDQANQNPLASAINARNRQPFSNDRNFNSNPIANKRSPKQNFSQQNTATAQLKRRLLNVTVRLKVQERSGHSNGTGTIIDAHGNEALVLTCGHLFRESGGKGKITVDTFGDIPQTGLQAKLLSYDDKRDIGLVSISGNRPFPAVAIAGKNSVLKIGDRVFHFGCSRGNDATGGETVITGINKYLGPDNLTIGYMPVEGRSGGGLFNAQGQLIGVCNAADPADKEGIYAALSPIRSELDRANLAFIYQKSDATANNSIRKVANNNVSNPAKFTPLGRNIPLEKNAKSDVNTPNHTLSSQERALVALSEKNNRAEVICIVRPLDNPRAKSEVIVLDRASTEFLSQLQREKQTQNSRFQTKHRQPNQKQTSHRPSNHRQPIFRQPAAGKNNSAKKTHNQRLTNGWQVGTEKRKESSAE